MKSSTNCLKIFPLCRANIAKNVYLFCIERSFCTVSDHELYSGTAYNFLGSEAVILRGNLRTDYSIPWLNGEYWVVDSRQCFDHNFMHISTKQVSQPWLTTNHAFCGDLQKLVVTFLILQLWMYFRRTLGCGDLMQSEVVKDITVAGV